LLAGPRQLSVLADLGLHTVADLEVIDARTLAVCAGGRVERRPCRLS